MSFQQLLLIDIIVWACWQTEHLPISTTTSWLSVEKSARLSGCHEQCAECRQTRESLASSGGVKEAPLGPLTLRPEPFPLFLPGLSPKFLLKLIQRKAHIRDFLFLYGFLYFFALQFRDVSRGFASRDLGELMKQIVTNWSFWLNHVFLPFNKFHMFCLRLLCFSFLVPFSIILVFRTHE